MTEADITDRLTQEVERLLGEVAKLEQEKRQDVSIWLKAKRDYRDRIDLLTARVKELERAMKEIAAQKKTTELVTACDVEYADFEDGYDLCIDRARAALSASQPAPMTLHIDEAKFLAAVDREGDHEVGAGLASQPAPPASPCCGRGRG